MRKDGGCRDERAPYDCAVPNTGYTGLAVPCIFIATCGKHRAETLTAHILDTLPTCKTIDGNGGTTCAITDGVDTCNASFHIITIKNVLDAHMVMPHDETIPDIMVDYESKPAAPDLVVSLNGKPSS